MFSSLVGFFTERKETKVEERKNEILRIIEEDNHGVRRCTEEFFYGRSRWSYYVLVEKIEDLEAALTENITMSMDGAASRFSIFSNILAISLPPSFGFFGTI